MKWFQKIALLVIPCLVLLLAAPAAQIPARAESYNYTINVSGGLHGTVTSDAELSVAYNPASPMMWNPNAYNSRVTLTDEKYYLKGWHISGKEGLVGATLIDQDYTFVATYGIRGDMVQYTVRYLEAGTEAQLAEPTTYYGNVGDKPVVAFLYVEGYTPNAYNETKTLVSDESQNVFTFYYTQNTEEAGETPATPTAPETPAAPGAGEGTGGAGGGAEAPVVPGVPVEPETPAEDIGDQDTPQAGGDNDDETSGGPDDLVDLDEETVPQAVNDDETPTSSFPTAAVVGGIGAAALLGFLIWLLAKRKKDEKEDDKKDEGNGTGSEG